MFNSQLHINVTLHTCVVDHSVKSSITSLHPQFHLNATFKIFMGFILSFTMKKVPSFFGRCPLYVLRFDAEYKAFV